MKKIFLMFILMGIFVIPAVNGNNPVWAGETDVLIDILQKKGILTPREAKEVLSEIQVEKDKEKAAVKAPVKEVERAEVKLPKWLENTKVKGDFRFRYQYEDKDDDSNDSRDRWRIRWRFGFETEINERWKTGFRLASGQDDPRSRNLTLDDTFDTSNVQLDLAYAQFDPHKNWRLVAGKFKNPLWQTKDLLWDSDINPEGISVQFLNYKINNFELFATPGFFVLDEIKSDTGDPWLGLIQAGAKMKLTDSLSFKFAGAFYSFQDLEGNDFDYSEGTNSRDAGGNFKYDYDAIGIDAELGMKLSGPVPYLGIFGQYVNSDVSDDDLGYLAGLKFGHKKVKKFGQWQVKYNYRRLEKDAWPDFLSDSDFYGGETDVQGNEIEFKFGLAKNVTLGVDYYLTERIEREPDQEQDVIQVDLVLKY
ncbi:MAG: putative porin [Desulfobacterales bacterium]|jgi:hypothetical protein